MISSLSSDWESIKCEEAFKESYNEVITLKKQGKSIVDFNKHHPEGFLDYH